MLTHMLLPHHPCCCFCRFPFSIRACPSSEMLGLYCFLWENLLWCPEYNSSVLKKQQHNDLAQASPSNDLDITSVPHHCLSLPSNVLSQPLISFISSSQNHRSHHSVTMMGTPHFSNCDKGLNSWHGKKESPHLCPDHYVRYKKRERIWWN